MSETITTETSKDIFYDLLGKFLIVRYDTSQQEDPQPSFKFDDTNPAIYGKEEDLDVPAFIRRQQD